MRNKTRLFIAILGVAVVLSITVIFLYSKFHVPKTLKAGSFKTETVKPGNVVSSIKANGVVVSENEELILSPARSVIRKVLKNPGSWVEEGDLILQLDEKNVKDEIERLSDQLEMKKNSLVKAQLNAESARLDLSYNEEVKKLRVVSLQSTLVDQEKLLETGGISIARIEKTKQEIVLAEKDLQKLTEKNSIRLKQMAADEKGLQLQIKVQEKTLCEKQDLLEKMNITAPSTGIILEVAGNEGVSVDVDKVLVRMSNLSSFKVLGTIDEHLASQVKTGKRVIVTIDNEELQGRVGVITPVDETTKVQFDVHLEEKRNTKLTDNKNVEMLIMTNERENVLRVRKIAGLGEEMQQPIYVVKGNEAVKSEIIFGTIGDHWCEIVSGVEDGEQIILESINVRELDRIKIRK